MPAEKRERSGDSELSDERMKAGDEASPYERMRKAAEAVLDIERQGSVSVRQASLNSLAVGKNGRASQAVSWLKRSASATSAQLHCLHEANASDKRAKQKPKKGI